MVSPTRMEDHEKQTAHAFRKKMLRHSFAIALGFGVATTAISNHAIAQFPSGDIPASPWSQPSETLQSNPKEETVRSNKRLRQPIEKEKLSIGNPASAHPTRISQPLSDKAGRPAPVTLLGPMPPSASFGSLREFQPESSSKDSAIGSTNLSRTPAALPSTVPSQSVSTLSPVGREQTLSPGGREQTIRLRSTPRMFPAESADNESDLIHVDRSVRVPATPRPVLPSRVPLTMAEPPSLDGASESGSVVDVPDESPLVFPPTASIAETDAALPAINDQPEKLPSSKELVLEHKPNAPQSLAISAAEEQRDSESQMRRIALAKRVSHELLSSSPSDSAGPPQALESLPGWQAIEHELRERLDRCNGLLKRGAVLSARQEASEGLLRLFRTMDLHRGKMHSESAYEKAETALREEWDFQKGFGGRDQSNVQAVVNTHRTDALKNRPLDNTSPEMAGMHYRMYARYQLVTASDGHPWAADLLYAYGKTIEKEAELNPSKASQFRSQAVVFYQSALKAKPSHSEAASQLGYALIHLDRIEDAYAALSDSIKQRPSANAWNNLAEVFRRRGAASEAEYAVQQASALSRTAPPFSSENPEIVAVDPATFAKYSPAPWMASPTPNVPMGGPSAIPNPSELQTRNAKSGNRFLSKIFQ